MWFMTLYDVSLDNLPYLCKLLYVDLKHFFINVKF